MTLDDIDWRSGEMLVCAKGRQRARMPMPPDVGAAVVAYLRDGRPTSSCRRLFLRTLAPNVGFASGCAITMIAKTALERAGVRGYALWLEAKLATVSGKSTIADAIRYALSRWDGLTRFLHDGRIEIDSNVVERSIRISSLDLMVVASTGPEAECFDERLAALLAYLLAVSAERPRMSASMP